MTNLSDSKIIEESQRNALIVGLDIKCVGPASYELRAGNIYYDLDEGTKRIDASKYDNTILIKPGHRVVIITHEELNMPNSMIGRAYLKGTLFSIGLTPVSTIVDPGFSGNLGIVTRNISSKYIRLPLLSPLAKIEFTHLDTPSTQAYTGQHGYKTSIWPVRHDLTFDHQSVSGDPRVYDEKLEGTKRIPSSVANELERIRRRQSLIDFILLASFLVQTTSMIAAFNQVFDIIVAIGVNIVSTALVAVFLYFARPK